MPLLAPPSSRTTANDIMKQESSPKRMQAAEIEMLVDDEDDEEAAIISSYDSRPFCVRKRRAILVCFLLLALIVSIIVGVGVVTSRNDTNETTKTDNDSTDAPQVPVYTRTSPPTMEASSTVISSPPPTPSPTSSPTRNPTTANPTATAVAPPTDAPTQHPTPNPTASPTQNPTPFPTQNPTSSPTQNPTDYPVVQPTGPPPTSSSPQPTVSPTPLPTQSETQASANDNDDDPMLTLWYNTPVTLQDGPMFQVLDQIPHDETAFTQGLTLTSDGRLFESTGINGQSTIRQLDPISGDILESYPLDSQYFGEGLVAVGNSKLIQITWKKATAFVWNPNDLSQDPLVLNYQTTKHNEGWGITYDDVRNELIVSDGSYNLIYWNVDTLETLRTLKVVRLNGSPATNMNELEFWRNRILANVWFEDVVLVIHPETGIVEKEYDFKTLWPRSERPEGTNVFNGISITDDPDVLLVTGKRWNRMYRIKLLP